MLYKNCRELPYHNFNEIQVEGDLNYLIKDKEKHDEQELTDHWLDILEEYFNLTNDFSQKKYFRDKSELTYLQLKLNVLKAIKPLSEFSLTKDQNKQLAEILKTYRIKNIDQDILGVSDDIRLKLKAFNAAHDTEKSSNFDETLAMLRLRGCQVNRHEVTVSELIALLDQIKKSSASKA